MVLDLRVSGQHLSLLGNPFVVAESYDFLEASFAFSDDWADTTERKAYFKLDTDTYEVPIAQDPVTLEWVITKDKHINLADGEWLIYVVGYLPDGDELIQRIPTNDVGLTVLARAGFSGGTFPSDYLVSYLKTNQTLEQTITGGVPKLSATRVISDANHLADKKFVDDAVAAVTADDFAHNSLSSLQGGTANEYYHVTSAEKTVIGDTSGTNTGDQVLPTRNSLGLDTDDTVTFANLSGTNTGDQDISGAISTHNTDAGAHANLGIVDAGGYYDATTVEGALQEVGGDVVAVIASKNQANGIVGTDAGARMLAAQLPAGIVSGSGIAAANSIVGSMLDTQYNYKSYLNAGNDLSHVVDAGIYIVNTVTSLPSGFSGLGTLEVIKGLSRWIIQKLYTFATPHVVWARKIDGDTFTPTTWTKTINDATDVKALLAASKLTKDHINSIDSTFLATSFCERGSATNIDLALSQGVYVATYSAVNGTWPSGWGSYTGILVVDNKADSWIIQSLSRLNAPEVQYVRSCYNNGGTKTYTEWNKIVAGNTYKPLYGKTIYVFGDSLSEDGGEYEAKISDRTGATVVSFGIGGTCLSYSASANYDALSMTRLADAITSGVWTSVDAAVAALSSGGDNNSAQITAMKAVNFSTAEYVMIYYGANDFGANHVPIGVNSDNGNTTFKGGINHVISTLQTAYPAIKFMFISPCCFFTDGLEPTNADGLYLSDYVDAMKEVCALQKIPCYDLYRNSGINSYNVSTLTVSEASRIHPNSTGNLWVGSRIAAWIAANFGA